MVQRSSRRPELSGADIAGPGESTRILFTDDEVAAIGEQASASGVWLSCHSQAVMALIEIPQV